jgi:hypothetical protein
LVFSEEERVARVFCGKEGGAVVLLLRRSKSCEVVEGKEQEDENKGLFDSSIKNFKNSRTVPLYL